MPLAYITRRGTFCAAHRLYCPSLTPEENEKRFGKCQWANGHGHNYILEVTLRGEIDPETGLILNLIDLKEIIQSTVVDVVDHRNLNLDIPIFKTLPPTTENMAVVFWQWLEEKLPPGLLYEVKLRETENNAAIYRGE